MYGYQDREPEAKSELSLFAEISKRLDAQDQRIAELHAVIDAGQKDGSVNFDVAHATHVLAKHFYHDRPEPVAASN
jgi:hypothetical protein